MVQFDKEHENSGKLWKVQITERQRGVLSKQRHEGPRASCDWNPTVDLVVVLRNGVFTYFIDGAEDPELVLLSFAIVEELEEVRQASSMLLFECLAVGLGFFDNLALMVLRHREYVNCLKQVFLVHNLLFII